MSFGVIMMGIWILAFLLIAIDVSLRVVDMIQGRTGCRSCPEHSLSGLPRSEASSSSLTESSV